TADGHDLFTVEGELLLEALTTLLTFSLLPPPVDPVMAHKVFSWRSGASFPKCRFTSEINLL
ncbi:hypothetical protein OFC05_28600, partial [Escherichia coli]|nr:hypothetical protein [Escherichia coli]